MVIVLHSLTLSNPFPRTLGTVLVSYDPGFARSDSCPVPRPLSAGYKAHEKVFIEKAVGKRQFPIGNSLTTPCRQMNYILPI